MKLNQDSKICRIIDHMKNQDTAFFTMSRSLYSHTKNKHRNLIAKARIITAGFSITSVSGNYFENYNTPDQVIVSDKVFFVIDLKTRGGLLETIINLTSSTSEDADDGQDSILFVPKGLEEGSYLIGTSKRVGNYPKFGERIKFPILETINGKDQFVSAIPGRPFEFPDTEMKYTDDTLYPTNVFSMMGWISLADRYNRTKENNS